MKEPSVRKLLSVILLAAVTLLPMLTEPAVAQWVQTNNPWYGDPRSFAVQGTDLFVGCNFVTCSRDGGTTWSVLGDSGLTNHDVQALAVLDSNIFVGNSWGVFRSLDEGASWQRMNSGLAYPPPVQGSVDVHCFAISGTRLFAGTQGGVFLSTNYGDNWAPVNAGLTDPAGYRPVCSLLVHGTELFAGTEDLGVFRTTDNGLNWTSVDTGLTGWVEALTASGDSVLAGTSTGLYVSVNGGTWTRIGAQWINSPVLALLVIGMDVFAGTDRDGVLLSRDMGATWVGINAGLPIWMLGGQAKISVNAFAVVGADIFASLLGGAGVFKRALSTIASASLASRDISGEAGLEQNYPNPFNPSTVIEYTVRGDKGWRLGASDVSLVVYDVLGRAVATLVNERKKAGSYKVTFDGSGLASGVYLCRLKTGSFVQTRAMVLVK